MSEKDRGNLEAILDASGKIEKFIIGISNADDFYEDEKTFDAVLMNFVIIGESVARLPKDFIENQNHIPWNQIKGFRNLVAHDYFGVDAEEVWQIVKNHLPILFEQIMSLIKE